MHIASYGHLYASALVVVILCHSLRTFFGCAERQGWCSGGLQKSICSPRVPRITEHLKVPEWQDVRRVIASIGSLKHSDLRAKAMFLLFSIYGFRSAEVRNLKLEDIDWRRESITIRRAKRGKAQQFPLRGEVGDAIALYLEQMRPCCPCRNVFVTLHPPYRPILGHSMASIVGLRMKKIRSYAIHKSGFSMVSLSRSPERLHGSRLAALNSRREDIPHANSPSGIAPACPDPSGWCLPTVLSGPAARARRGRRTRPSLRRPFQQIALSSWRAISDGRVQQLLPNVRIAIHGR